MTLLVGVRCSDCVILAADGAASYGSFAQQTVKQEARKIAIVAPGAVIATSGPVGLGQRLAGELAQPGLLQSACALESWQCMALIRAKFAEHILQELTIAATAARAIGQGAMASALSHTLVALTVQGKPRLFQFDQQGAPEECVDLPWVTAGSGQGSADPFFSFLRRVFWPGRIPTREEAIFTALWTVVQGIESATGGIGGEPQVVVLEGSGAAIELAGGDLQEHRESIRAAEKALGDFRLSLRATPAPAMPVAPAGA